MIITFIKTKLQNIIFEIIKYKWDGNKFFNNLVTFH